MLLYPEQAYARFSPKWTQASAGSQNPWDACIWVPESAGNIIVTRPSSLHEEPWDVPAQTTTVSTVSNTTKALPLNCPCGSDDRASLNQKYSNTANILTLRVINKEFSYRNGM